MKIELSPSESPEQFEQVFTARFVVDSEVVAEIKDAPQEIATQWAEVMKELHDGIPVIKRLGICFYCGSMDRNGVYCGDCQRVFVVG